MGVSWGGSLEAPQAMQGPFRLRHAGLMSDIIGLS